MDSEDGESRVVDVVKTEGTRQTIILVFSLVGTVLTYYVIRKLQEPDSLSTAKMAGALVVKRWSDKQADRFNRLSLRMATIYNGEKW